MTVIKAKTITNSTTTTTKIYHDIDQLEGILNCSVRAFSVYSSVLWSDKLKQR